MPHFTSRDEYERWKGRQTADTLTVARTDLEWAAGQGLIAPGQVEPLWLALVSRTPAAAAAPAPAPAVQGAGPQRFDLVHVAYYFGALLVISAMGWFMTLGWESLGGGGIFLIATAYATIFALAGWTLWFRQGLRVPGGLLITLAVWMTPLAVYGLERLTGLWPQDAPGAFREYHVWVMGSWLVMEVATILAGLIALRFVRFPFLTFPIAFTLWYMSMDLTPLLFGQREFGWEHRLLVSLVFGLVVLVVAYAIDRRTEEDYAFWGYLFGLLAFWGGLSLMKSGGQAGRFGYCLINVALMVVSVLLQRRVFMVFGALGVFTYLSYLSWGLFRGSLVFPFVLSGIGIAIIYLAITYQRNQPRIEGALLGWLPAAVRRALPMQRAGLGG